jgi:hypothetical protein
MVEAVVLVQQRLEERLQRQEGVGARDREKSAPELSAEMGVQQCPRVLDEQRPDAIAQVDLIPDLPASVLGDLGAGGWAGDAGEDDDAPLRGLAGFCHVGDDRVDVALGEGLLFLALPGSAGAVRVLAAVIDAALGLPRCSVPG